MIDAHINKEAKTSDRSAKQQFRIYLQKLGYETDWKASGYDMPCPADVYAKKNDEVFLFEIKKTKKDKYFGGATYTEWNAAYNEFKGRYYFVIAYEDEAEEKSDSLNTNDTKYDFYLISPQNLAQYSVIPPFKIYFNIDSKKNAMGKRDFLPKPNRNDTSVLFRDEEYRVLEKAWSELKHLANKRTDSMNVNDSQTKNSNYVFMALSKDRDIIEQIKEYEGK